MNLERQPNQIEGEKEIKIPFELLKMLKHLFSTNETPEKKMEYILTRTKKFVDAGVLDGDKFTEQVNKCLDIGNEAEFIAGMVEALRPYLEAKMADPKRIEQLEREVFLERENFIPLNEILSYGRSGGEIHIHLAPSREIVKEGGFEGLSELVRGGLRELAKIVENNADISTVTATSKLVTKHQKQIEELGFRILGPISDEDREKYFPGQSGKIDEAEMAREEFLAKYL